MSEPEHLQAGPHGSVDKYTFSFKGRHKDKQKSNAKAKDMVLSLIVIVIIFSCSFHFRNMSALENHMRLKLSTFHNRVLDLFDAFSDSNHKYWVDNLYTSVKFVVQSLKHKVYVMLEGEFIKGSSGFLYVCK